MRKPIATTMLGAASFLIFTAMVHADEIRVLSTQATEEAYRELVPQFEKASGHKVTTVFTGTLDANKRLAAGETYDLLIMSAPSIDEHIKDGKVVPGSRVDLARSGIGVGVKAGAPKPDIGRTEALKKKRCWRPSRSATPPVRAGSTWSPCSSALASPTRSGTSSSRRRRACSWAASSPAGRLRSASSR